MTFPSNSPSPGPQAAQHVEALLRETAWIRRLARGLLGDRAAAEDLSQEILVVAISQDPELDPPRLRAWLRTVARRLVTRGRERERARSRVELRAARPEGVEQETQERLLLHQQLAAAIDGLAPTYRTVLVLRYLEELPPREIAKRLGLTPEVARKRVSRGLAMLREALDAEFDGGRKSWSLAVGGLLAPSAGSLLPHPAPSPGVPLHPMSSTPIAALPMFALMTKKILLVVSLLLAASFALLLTEPFALSPEAAQVGVSREAGPALGELPRSAPTFAEKEPDESAQREAVVAAASVIPPQVRVLRIDGGSVPNAGVAWIDAAGHPQGLTLDSEGSAERPEGSAGRAFFACAPGFAEAYVQAGATGMDVELVLEPQRVLRGRLIEDGGPPTDSVYLWALDSDRDRGLPDVWETRAKLEGLGAMRSVSSTWTEPDGSFALEGLTPGGTGRLHLPTTHRPILDGIPSKDSGVRFDGEDDDLVIESVALPRIRGRLLWADDGTPVVGTLTFMMEKREGGNTRGGWGQTDPSGAFVVGLDVSERALLEPPAARADALLHRAVSIYLDDVNGTAAPFVQRVELANETFPVDLGVLTVTRAKLLTARVVGPEGVPVAGATVVSSLASAVSDSDGQVQLSTQGEDQLQVLAPGFAYASFPVEVVTATEAPCELRLEPGHTLAVVLAAKDGAGPDVTQPVQLAWERSPFEGAHITGEAPFAPMPDRIHRRYHKGTLVNGGWSHATEGAPGSQGFTPPATGELLIPGLRGGSSFSIAVVDALNQALVEQTVTMPVGAGLHRVDLSVGPEKISRLRVRMVDGWGAPLKVNGSLFVLRGDGKRGRAFDLEDGLLEQTLAPGSYALTPQISGYMSSKLEGYALAPGSPLLDLALEPCRPLEVRIADESGRPVGTQFVGVEAADGWKARASEANLGRASFRKLPLRPLELRIQIGTRTFTESIDDQQEQATVVLPAHGQLLLRFARKPDLMAKRGTIRARIHEQSGAGEIVLNLSYTETAAEDLRLETELLPGAYELQVDLVESRGANEPAVRNLDRRTFTIKAGELTAADLED